MLGVSTSWKVEHLEECPSTFNVARRLPPWTVVSCTRQTAGRGRFNRAWFGEADGLWACYNVPLDPAYPRNWGLLPLVAGAAIMAALSAYAIPGLRLRWPNDVLVGRAKLAGILVERPAAGMASLGIGINVQNDVAALIGKTQDPPTRLADHVPTCPSAHKLRTLLAHHIAETFHYFCEGGLEALAHTLDAAWGESRPVVAVTDTERLCGFFEGVAADGSPILRRADGSRLVVPGISVVRLKELL